MGLEKAIAKVIFRKMTGQGLRPMQLIRMAKDQGGSYRKQDMLNDIRKYEDRIKYQTLIEALDPGVKIPRAYMIETELGVDAKYRIHGFATFYDEEIDDYYEQKVSFYTDDWAVEDEYSEAFADTFTGIYQEEMLDFISFRRTATEHNKGYSY